MIVSIEHRFVFLSVPKCASSAIFREIRDFGQITMYGRPPLKHAPYASLERHIFPFLEERLSLDRSSFCVLCLFREPIDWLHSWYRYRRRPRLRNPSHPRHANYTGDLTFDAFVDQYLNGEPGAARVGSQAHHVTATDGSLGPDAVFRYEDIDAAVARLQQLTGRRIRLRRRRVSPRGELVLDAGRREALVQAMRRDFEIYGSLDSGL